MIINKLFLKKYGKFENKEFLFSPNLNIFMGKNESGKSTISTALKTLFYADLNGKGKYKKNFIPLNETKGSFDADYTLDSKVNLKSLVTLGKTNAKTLIKTINSDTGETYNLESINIGEDFFNISEEMFDSVCYIKDTEQIANIMHNKEYVHDTLSKNENNIIDIDLSDVLKEIKDEILLFERKTQSGKIYPLSVRLKEVEEALYNLTEIKESLKSTKEKKEQLIKNEQAFKEQLKDIEKKEEYILKYKEYKNAKEQVNIRKEIESLKEKAQKSKISFNEIPPSDLEKLKAFENFNFNRKNTLFSLISGIGIIVLSFVLSFINLYLGFLSLIGAYLLIDFYRKNKTNEIIKNKKEEYTYLLNKYNITSVDEYIRQKEDFLKNEGDNNLIKQRIEFLTLSLKDYNESILNHYFEEPSYTLESLQKEKENIKKELFDTTILINTLSEQEKNAFNNMPHYNLLILEKEELMDKIDKLKEEAKIATDCYNILNITSNSFKSSYIPYLNCEVKNILNEIFDENVDYFNINDDLSCELRRENNTDIIPKENFSKGTNGLIYFALRLSIYKLISENEKIPLILDDCFLDFDDERYEKIIKYIEKNVNSQIFYFTSHERIFNLTLANSTINRL